MVSWPVITVTQGSVISRRIPATKMAFTEDNRQDLQDKGFTVVKDVLTEKECRKYISQYKQWLSTNFAEGEFPLCSHSLIQRYAIGHLDTTWQIRLKSRDVFAQLWGTNRLLSSVDAVAIGKWY